MRIKLLTKNEISKARNADRAKEVTEGLKISRKVDSLRELKAKEEEALEKFRVETLSVVGKEINELISKKETLLSEVKILRKELQAETTLSKAERKNLESLKNSLEEKEKQLTEKSEELALAEIDIAIALKESRDALLRASTQENIAVTLRKQSEEDRLEAKQSLLAARSVEQRVLTFKEDAERSLSLKEVNLSERQNSLALQEEENLKVSRELEQEKIRLADQRATLERALERIRKNRL